jgi:hypothetical protein
MMSNHLAEIEPNQTNANSALKVLYIEQLGLPILKLESPRNLLEIEGFLASELVAQVVQYIELSGQNLRLSDLVRFP